MSDELRVAAHDERAVFTALALAGDGLFATSAATAAGVHHTVLRRAVRTGTLLHVRHGWYALSASRTPEAWHLLRLRAELMVGRGYLAASHDSALLVHGLPMNGSQLGVVQLADVRGGWSRRTRGRWIHALPATAPWTTVTQQVGSDGELLPPTAIDRADRCSVSLPVVAPEIAAVQVGLVLGPREALAVADAVLRAGSATVSDLARAAECFRHVPGIAAVAIALAKADARAESPGESRLRHDLLALGYPVEPQVVITVEGREYRADLGIRGTRVLLEYDGEGKYDDPEELRYERRREADLRSAGWEFARFLHEDIGHFQRIKHRVDSALARAEHHARSA